jgi:hypothetical protein
MKITIDAPQAVDEEELADELERIAGLVRQGYQSGEVHGGWWHLEGDYAEPEDDEPDVDDDVTKHEPWNEDGPIMP